MQLDGDTLLNDKNSKFSTFAMIFFFVFCISLLFITFSFRMQKEIKLQARNYLKESGQQVSKEIGTMWQERLKKMQQLTYFIKNNDTADAIIAWFEETQGVSTTYVTAEELNRFIQKGLLEQSRLQEIKELGEALFLWNDKVAYFVAVYENEEMLGTLYSFQTWEQMEQEIHEAYQMDPFSIVLQENRGLRQSEKLQKKEESSYALESQIEDLWLQLSLSEEKKTELFGWVTRLGNSFALEVSGVLCLLIGYLAWLRFWFYHRVRQKEEQLRSDRSKQAAMREQMRMNEQRLRLIMDKSDTMIFHWDLQKDSAQFSNVWEKKMGYPSLRKHFLTELEKRQLIHPKDMKKFVGLLTALKQGKRYGEVIARVRKVDGEYIWLKICILLVSENNDLAIGIAIDIDQEMRNSLALQEEVNKDHLTGLFNKKAMQNIISAALLEQDVSSALFILDLDNFKNLNDTLGHLAGDKALTTIAEGLKHIFNQEEALGRFGGDEFVIFMKDIKNETLVKEKADAICRHFESISLEGCIHVPISVSIGAAIAKSDDTFETLFQRADGALYDAKDKGRNTFEIYNQPS